MEEETSINFKALRARFQEEARLAESKANRPAVAGKPKYLPPPGGHCSSVISSIHMAAGSEHGDEPTYADLTSRPASAPGELPSEKPHTDDQASLQGREKTSECTLSSPDITISPTSAEGHTDADCRLFSSLEKAKKKFSCRQMISLKPKNSSPGKASPPKSTLSTDLPTPPPFPVPLNLPNFIYISARPFSKGITTFKSPLEKHFGKDKSNRPFVRIGDPRPPSPQKKPLPENWTLGPAPPKPCRPPRVDLSSYKSNTSRDVSLDLAALHQHDSESTTSVPILDIPEIPDFESSEIEAAEESVDIAVIDLDTLDLPVPKAPGPSASGECSDLTQSSEHQDLDLGHEVVNPPASFPEPINLSEFPEPVEQWSQNEESIREPPSCTEEAADSSSIPEDQGEHGSNFEFGIYQQEMYETTCDNVYEDVENVSKVLPHQNSRKWKGLKNPYADSNNVKEESGCSSRQRNPRNIGESGYLSHSQINSKECQSPKEQKKREKQRLEKEKKEQKEREKKENEMKKKFKVTGLEEPMYHAKVTVASKVRKRDLPVKSGDTVSIIRTTNCPKGKWLARDADHKYGYISVMNVELNIKEMLELGKKAQAAGRGGNMEADTISIGSSSHPVLTSSCEFTDDSEEWACEDETLSPVNDSPSFPHQSSRVPEMSSLHDGTQQQHTLSDANLEDLHTQTRHEALQKLAIFFQHNKEPEENGVATATSLETPNLCDVEELPVPEQEMDFTELEFLPPPPLYADFF
uniref:Helically-extended SH3 domain-containing protein n=1 Tax=Knipowitschia caucasica TaxID=637954 RepID=A0AAV2JQN9_KNICA